MLSVWFIFIMITLLFFIWDQYYIPWKKQKISFFHSHIVILVFNLFSFRNATSITFESSKQERISVIKNVYSFLYSFGSRNREPLFFLQTFVVNHISSWKYARKYISYDTPKYFFFKIYRGCECIKSTYQFRAINYALLRVLRFGLRNGQTSSRCQLALISLDFTRNR